MVGSSNSADAHGPNYLAREIMNLTHITICRRQRYRSYDFDFSVCHVIPMGRATESKTDGGC